MYFFVLVLIWLDIFQFKIYKNYDIILIENKLSNFKKLGWGYKELKIILDEFLKYTDKVIFTKDLESNNDFKSYQNDFNIIDFLNFPERVFPIGRLDKSTTGLILLTNDGETANRILKTANNNEKEYLVKVNRPIPESILKKMSEGVPMLGKITRKCVVEKVKTNQFKIILTQGLNRQIRRMCDHFGYKVVSLQRIRIMNIKLDLPEGKYRLLNEQEIKGLKK